MNKLDLKRPAQDFTYCGLSKRYEKTKAFILEYALWLRPVLGESLQPVLDIGEANPFGERLAKELEYKYHWTEGDLNHVGWSAYGERYDPRSSPLFKTVLCLEVLEHLKNPDLFLGRLHRYLDDDALIVISFPRHLHPVFWSRTHFHEFDENRITLLLEEAGYEIILYKSSVNWPDFKVFFKGKKIGKFWIPGIRPMLRLFSGWWLLSLARQNFYLLKEKE